MLTILLLSMPLPQTGPAPPPARPCRAANGRGRPSELDKRMCAMLDSEDKRSAFVNAIDRATSIKAVEEPMRTASTLMTFDVTQAGKVENCRVVESSGVAELDAKACAALTDKGRYTPATGPHGPKRSTQRLRVRWQTRN